MPNTRYGLQSGQQYTARPGFYRDPYNNQQANRGMSERPRINQNMMGGRFGMNTGPAQPIGQPRYIQNLQGQGLLRGGYGVQASIPQQLVPESINNNPGPAWGSTPITIQPSPDRRPFAAPPRQAAGAPGVARAIQMIDEAMAQADAVGQRRGLMQPGLGAQNMAMFGFRNQRQPQLGNVREQADRILKGGMAPQQQFNTPSQQALLNGPIGSVNGVMRGDEGMVEHNAMSPEQIANFATRHGLERTQGLRSAGRDMGVGLKGTPFEDEGFAAFRARESDRRQLDKDTNLLANAHKFGLNHLPNVQQAMNRRDEFVNARQRRFQAANHLHDMKLEILKERVAGAKTFEEKMRAVDEFEKSLNAKPVVAPKMNAGRKGGQAKPLDMLTSDEIKAELQRRDLEAHPPRRFGNALKPKA